MNNNKNSIIRNIISCFVLFTHFFINAQQDSTQNIIPTLQEAVKGMQKGQRFNLKKIIKAQDGDLFTSREDNPSLRLAYDQLRLANPTTETIPLNIREKELKYVFSKKAHLQESPYLIKRSANNALAPGDQSSPWINRGPFNVGGRTRALALDINDEDRILAGGVSGGLWESEDQGSTWSRITPAQEHPSITDIVQDPRTGFQNIWYYCTGERIGNSASARNSSGFYQGNGVYKSIDNGETFSPLPETVNASPESFSSNDPFDLCFGIDVDPTNGDIYVATFAGVYRSTNGGSSFEEVLDGEFDNISDIHITSTGVLYATLDSDNNDSSDPDLQNGGIFRSEDGANGTWEDITPASFPASFGRTVLYTAPSNENILYVFAANTPTAPVGHDFWKFTYDAADIDGIPGTWENRSVNLPNFGGPVGSTDTQGGYDMFVRIHPTNADLVFIGTTNIYRSADGFSTSSGQWIGGYSPLNNVSLYTNHHPDQHNLLFLPSDPDVVISAHDGGLSITNNILENVAGTEPVSWTSLNNGYLTTQVYALSIGPGNQLMAGFQDNSTWLTTSTSSTSTWSDQFSGDGSYNAFNDDGTLRYVSAQNGVVYRVAYTSADSETPLGFQNIQPSGSSQFLFVNPFELDPNNDEIMYFASGTSLWRNDQLSIATTSVGWTQLSNAAAPGGDASAIGISTLPANVVYFGTTTGQLLRIADANVGDPSATNVTGANFPSGNISSIAIDPQDADKVYVTFSNYGIPSIFFSDDGGTSWIDISGNLEENVDGSGSGPSVRWLNIVGKSDRFLVGTSTGLYTSTSINGSSTSWTQVDPDGIGNVVVEQIRSREDGLAVVGTHGNGLYSANFEVTEGISVQNPIDDLVVASNAVNTNIDVSEVFVSDNDPPLEITVTLENNTNAILLTASISNDILTLDYAPDEFGKAVITLRGEDTNGSAALTSFNVTVNPSPVSTFPYFENFDTNGGSLPLGWSTSSTTSYPWLVNTGSTPSNGTGPTVDNTTGSDFYVYTEATGAESGDVASLLSREIDLKGVSGASLSFAYHMFGAAMGTLKVNIIANNVKTTELTLTGQQQSNQSDAYQNDFIQLDDYLGEVITIEFEGTRGSGFTSDIAIDDVMVQESSLDDLAVTEISPSNDVYGIEDVSVVIRNLGINTQTSYDVAYFVDDVEIDRETLSTSLNSGEELSFTFANPFDFSAEGTYNLKAKVFLTGDDDSSNDEISQEVIRRSFTGDYTLIQVSGPSLFENFVFDTDGIDEIFINSTDEDTRSFSAVYLEEAGVGQPPAVFSFTLNNSDEVVFSDNQPTNLAISNVSILLGTADAPGSYDPTDENSFSLTLKEDVNAVSGDTRDIDFMLFNDPNLNVWNGSISSEWSNDANWSLGTAPVATDVVLIPTTSSNDPEINSEETISDLVIQYSSSLVVNAGYLEVTGDLINGGLLTISSGASITLMGNRLGSGTELISRAMNSSGALSAFGLPIDGKVVGDIGNLDFLFDYDNSSQDFFIPASGDPMSAGKGFFGSATFSNFLVSGEMAYGDIETAITLSTDGFNLVANPYGAAIDASAFFSNATNMNSTTGTAYLWNDGGENVNDLRGGDYITVNSMGIAGGPIDPGTALPGDKSSGDFTGNFHSFQGFFVEATQSGIVSFTPDMQVTSDNSNGGFFRNSDDINSIKLSLSNEQLYTDIIVGLDDDATFEDDYSMDATKFAGNSQISFFSKQGDKEYTIQALPKLNGNILEVQLGYHLLNEGGYQITVPQATNIGQDIVSYLIDQNTGRLYKLSEGVIINFDHFENANPDRFLLVFSSSPLAISNEFATNELKVYGTTQALTIEYIGSQQQVLIYDLQGKLVFDQVVDFTAGNAIVNPDLSNNRIYIINVNDTKLKFLLRR